MGRGTVLIHLHTDQRFYVRKGQTIMRDSWRTVPHHVACLGSEEAPTNKVFDITDDPRAVTCPECKKTQVFDYIMDQVINRGK